MNRKVQILTFGLLLVLCAHWGTELRALYMGALQFPRTLKKVPSLRLYFAGNKIPCTTNSESGQITFNLPSYQRNRPLYMLVTEHVQWCAEENTIKFLKTDTAQPYKLFLMTPIRKKGDAAEPSPSWETSECSLDAEGKIPDNTLIIVFNPELIEHLEGGSSINLPKVCMHDNLLDLTGSEEQFHAMTEELLLSALDTDTIHKKIQHTVQPHYTLKTVLALTI